MSELPAEEVDRGLDSDEEPEPREGQQDESVAQGPDHLVAPDDPDDPARSPRTLGIDNTDTALGPEDESAPVE